MLIWSMVREVEAADYTCFPMLEKHLQLCLLKGSLFREVPDFDFRFVELPGYLTEQLREGRHTPLAILAFTSPISVFINMVRLESYD